MSSLTKADVNKILGVEFVFFGHVEVTPQLVEAWWLHFRHCEKGEFFAALHIAVNKKDNGFPPAPGEVWAEVRKLRATHQTLETADRAWHELWHGAPSKRALAAAEIMPEWDKRGQWDEKYMHFRKKEFERIYNDLKEQDDILETQGIARDALGYAREQLPEAAKKVMEAIGCRL